MSIVNNRDNYISLAKFSLLSDKAHDQLAEMGWLTNSYLILLKTISITANPDLTLKSLFNLRSALNNSIDLSEMFSWKTLELNLLEKKDFRERFFALLGFSEVFGDFLYANPDKWQYYLTENCLPDKNQLNKSFSNITNLLVSVNNSDKTEIIKLLKTEYRKFIFQIAMQDIVSAFNKQLSITVIGNALAELAVAGIKSSLAIARNLLKLDNSQRFTIIAMGKTGAAELNYASDIDLIFIAEPALETANKLATEFLHIATESMCEIDTALRPEGDAGVLVRTVNSHINYYQYWAHTWEFQALLKARYVAGDKELADEYLTALKPMVWKASSRPNFVEDVQNMRKRVEQNIPVEIRGRELKLGPGGIRDIEFAVQLLQLVHGQFDLNIRSSNTISALQALIKGGYIGVSDGESLIESYEFLRVLENRLQIRRLHREHLLPKATDTENFRWLSRSLSLAIKTEGDRVELIINAIKQLAITVRSLHEKIFYRPLLHSVTKYQGAYKVLQDQEYKAERQLFALGFPDPKLVFHHIKFLINQPGRRGILQTLLLPTLLGLLSNTPNPGQGVLAYRKLSEKFLQEKRYLSLLRDENSIAERLMYLLGTSKLISDLIEQYPDMIPLLADGSSEPKLNSSILINVKQSISMAVNRHNELDTAFKIAKSMGQVEISKIITADLLNLIPITEIQKRFTAAREAVVFSMFDRVLKNKIIETNTNKADIAMFALGSFGGEEMNYISDLDVIFVCEPKDNIEESEAVQWATEVTDLIIKSISNTVADISIIPLKLDIALRPEGKNGPIIRTLTSYFKYYQNWAKSWEIQSLLKARFISGSAKLAKKFINLINTYRYPADGISTKFIKEIRYIKARIETERLFPVGDLKTDIKLGHGGLVDIAWGVQLLQLKHAGKIKELQNQNTITSIKTLHKFNYLNADQTETLINTWFLANKVRNLLTLISGKKLEQIPGSGVILTTLAETQGFNSTAAFIDKYLQQTRKSRKVFNEIFWEDK